MKKLLFTLALLIPLQVNAADVLSGDLLTDVENEIETLLNAVMPPPIPGPIPYRRFRASGIHICDSVESIGYQCKAEGVNYSDCTEAFFKLQRDHCCADAYYNGKKVTNGRSVYFAIQSCTSVH